MSYDIDLIPPAGTERVEVGTMTWNVAPLYYEALPGERGLNGLSGRRAGEAIPDLTAALLALIGDPDKYEPLVRGDNWGSYDGAINYLFRLRQKCREYPDYLIDVC